MRHSPPLLFLKSTLEPAAFSNPSPSSFSHLHSPPAQPQLVFISISISPPPLRRPSKVIPPNLHIIIRKLPQLIIIQTQQLRLFTRSQLQARHKVDQTRNKRTDYEGIGGTGNDVGELDVELFVVVVEPAADYVIGGEEAVEEEADHPCDSVLGEVVHRVVYAEPEFDCEGLARGSNWQKGVSVKSEEENEDVG
jgi:hypothetical protein